MDFSLSSSDGLLILLPLPVLQPAQLIHSRSSASPISHLPPFLLQAMTGGMNNGPRLDALLRQVAQGAPPHKKAKVSIRKKAFSTSFNLLRDN